MGGATYHLPRASFWLQERAVGYIDHANDARLDGNPPGGEIGLLWTMALSGGDRLVALPQLSAASALVVGVVGIAGRIGLSARSALLGGLSSPRSRSSLSRRRRPTTISSLRRFS